MYFLINPTKLQNPCRFSKYYLLKKTGVRKITFHDLRHMHASLLIKLGAQPKVVMGRLGHRDVETSIRYYSHLYTNANQEAVAKLETELLNTNRL
ncbi:tyrosine-type recombinase/integrase [Schinkia azotoformans]|uniref:tyrosine-type recombinase/integrase n=1 Tax=Schinkia azotoformans TaxID=1454 RepID=UPI002DC00E68|nr:tyrosine-type recombinase/integrase [Schinkia azotoformans]MEC1716438.1 tyrosine-type recombinase/integrase [Schinkia azotoformans]MEC1743599.1 tyrosine-type recombinase/integrase [Schinkia azotoformans]MEC1747678.1 tyrosine-type recombinase/integrase [Schinkia azotoformans]MEC1760350.1 tyrosine-type recombinase/integrase [Schinkia azotoformans]MEC1769099.1 tyrosine-type recombinase/integrase [Schinkia azotoformans]